MATKSDKYPFVEQSFTTSENQYYNLNSNQSKKCTTLIPVQSYSKTNDDKYCEKEKLQLWNKSSEVSTFTTLNEDNNDLKNRWKNENTLKTTNKSTLSLHIAAFENSVESDLFGENENIEGLKREKFGSIKTSKQCFTDSLKSQNPFEFPRQQNGDQRNKPEVMQFKASQRLLGSSRPSSAVTSDVMQKATGKLPQGYLKQLQDKEVGANGAIKKPRLAITDSFPLPTSSDRASIGKQSEGRIGAFDIKGTVKIKEKQLQQATIIEDQLAVLKEVYSDNNIDAECSKAADNMQEPRPPGDDCPEVGNLTIGQSNEVVPSSQPEDDVVPSSQPEDDPHEVKELSELEALITSSAKTSSARIGRIAIVDDNEKSRLFGPQPSRVLRSQNRLSNRPLVPYEYTSPVIPRRNIKRSFEEQSDSDFIDDSAVNVKPKRTSNGRSTPAKDGKIPELPPDYDQTLEARNFITKGRKQCDETFGELSIKGYDLYSLRTRQYVNDLIIDNYLKLVCKRSLLNTNNYRKSYAFGTFFYTMLNNGQDQEKLASWVKENLFEFELLFLPINQENHWFLFVVDMVARNFFIYDSLYYGDYTFEIKQLSGFLKFYAAKIKHEIDWDEWSTAPTADQIGPNQTNGVDCGIFLCQYAEHLSRRAKLDFSQRGMVNYRKIMLYELMNGELLPKYDDVEPSNQDAGS